MSNTMPTTTAHAANLKALAAMREANANDDAKYCEAMQVVRALEGVTAELQRHDAERVQRQAEATIAGKPFDARDPLGDQLRVRKLALESQAPVSAAVADQLIARIRDRETRIAAMRPALVTTAGAALVDAVAARHQSFTEKLHAMLDEYVEIGALAAACDSLLPHGSRVPGMSSGHYRTLQIELPDLAEFKPLLNALNLGDRIDRRKSEILAALGMW